MKSQTLILLVVAASCGLVAMLGVQRVLNNNEKEPVDTAQVMVAATPLNVGDPLNELNTQFITVERSVCPPGAVTSLDEIKERALKVPAVPGDWILISKLTNPGETGPVANIPPGMRVTTIQVDATTSHSGMLRPGNRVDVLLTWQDVDNSGHRQEKVRPLLEYIEVFAVDDKVYGINKDGGGAAKTISVLVTPKQASLLQLARKKGDLSTTLRSNADVDEANVAELSEDNLEFIGAKTPRDVSALNVREQAGPAFQLPSQGSLLNQLQNEWSPGLDPSTEQPFASGPVSPPGVMVAAAQPENVWKIAIHENGSVREVEVKLDPDDPVATPADAPADTEDEVSGSVWDLDEKLDGALDVDLKKAASGLLELLN